VTVTIPPRLQVTRFVAFGDSITAGEIAFNIRLVLDPTRSYPTELFGLLRGRYTGQTLEVFNEGQLGETAELGSRRISAVMDRRQPEVLLLLEGVNDLSERLEMGIDSMIEGLKYDIRDAQRRNVKVLVSTLLPQKPGFRAGAIDIIAGANRRIRDLAARERVVLVDAWEAFHGREATLIGDDGLHPTIEGYQQLAQTFYDKIRSTFEVPPAAPLR
jgi:lysophospholipase L1-like esterase